MTQSTRLKRLGQTLKTASAHVFFSAAGRQLLASITRSNPATESAQWNADYVGDSVLEGLGSAGFVLVGHLLFYYALPLVQHHWHDSYNSKTKRWQKKPVAANVLTAAGWLMGSFFVSGGLLQPSLDLLRRPGNITNFYALSTLTGVTTGSAFLAATVLLHSLAKCNNADFDSKHLAHQSGLVSLSFKVACAQMLLVATAGVVAVPTWLSHLQIKTNADTPGEISLACLQAGITATLGFMLLGATLEELCRFVDSYRHNKDYDAVSPIDNIASPV